MSAIQLGQVLSKDQVAAFHKAFLDCMKGPQPNIVAMYVHAPRGRIYSAGSTSRPAWWTGGKEMQQKYYRRKRRGFHFVGARLRYDENTKTPADGVWLRLPPGAKRPRCCRSGFHASPNATDARQYRPFGTEWLCYVEVQHVTDNRPGDKFTGRARKILARMPLATFDRMEMATRSNAELNRRVRAYFRKAMKGRK